MARTSRDFVDDPPAAQYLTDAHPRKVNWEYVTPGATRSGSTLSEAGAVAWATLASATGDPAKALRTKRALISRVGERKLWIDNTVRRRTIGARSRSSDVVVSFKSPRVATLT